jgi:GNAT superfamily N-acetyltransferase
MGAALSIRSAVPSDVPLILAFVHELAVYERSPQSVRASEGDLLRDGFGPSPRFHCLIAEWDSAAAGFALFFYSYSTWEGRAGIYIEDIYVRPDFRKRGIGRALFSRMARIAKDEQLGHISWQVLDWNQPAIDFYQSLGATLPAEWKTMRLDQAAIGDLCS